MLLPRSWRWYTTLDWEMLSLLNAFWRLLTGFASLAWSTALESTILGWPCLIIGVLATRAKFLQLSGYYTVIKHTFTFCTRNIFDSLCGVMARFKLVKVGWLGFMAYPYLPTPPLGQDMTRSIFKQSLTGLNSEFPFS